MVKAAAKMGDGRTMFIFGLSARNIELLKAGQPIAFDLEPLGGAGAVTIMFGETEPDIANQLREIARLPGDAEA